MRKRQYQQRLQFPPPPSQALNGKPIDAAKNDDNEEEEFDDDFVNSAAQQSVKRRKRGAPSGKADTASQMEPPITTTHRILCRAPPSIPHNKPITFHRIPQQPRGPIGDWIGQCEERKGEDGKSDVRSERLQSSRTSESNSRNSNIWKDVTTALINHFQQQHESSVKSILSIMENVSQSPAQSSNGAANREMVLTQENNELREKLRVTEDALSTARKLLHDYEDIVETLRKELIDRDADSEDKECVVITKSPIRDLREVSCNETAHSTNGAKLVVEVLSDDEEDPTMGVQENRPIARNRVNRKSRKDCKIVENKGTNRESEPEDDESSTEEKAASSTQGKRIPILTSERSLKKKRYKLVRDWSNQKQFSKEPPRQPKKGHAAKVIDDSKVKFVGVERRQSERAKMKARECHDCSAFYDAYTAGLDADGNENRAQQLRKAMVSKCGRHRDHHTPPETPPGFWDIMPFSPASSSQEQSPTEKPLVRRRLKMDTAEGNSRKSTVLDDSPCLIREMVDNTDAEEMDTEVMDSQSQECETLLE